jgi:hypothetical protein
MHYDSSEYRSLSEQADMTLYVVMPASTLYAKIDETIATEIAQGEYRPKINYLPKMNCFMGKF